MIRTVTSPVLANIVPLLPIEELPVKPITNLARAIIGVNIGVTNKHGVTSILVGTSHIVDQESFNHPSIQKIINASSCLYTEEGLHTLELLPSKEQLDAHPHSQRMLRVLLGYDLALILAAQKKGIPIHALDEGSELTPQREEVRAAFLSWMEMEEADLLEMLTTEEMEASSTTELWKQGNIYAMAELRERELSEDLVREEDWLEKLGPVLDETREPIVIGVGATHVCGEDSLTERLIEKGFTVNLLT